MEIIRSREIIIPKGIRFISDWDGYTLEDYQFPHILNKTITGCGFTEYCIRNSLNVILCSPRRILLKNKEDQHNDPKKNIFNVYYVRNEIEKVTNYEKDFSGEKAKPDKEIILGLSEEDTKARIMKLKDGVKDYWKFCQPSPFNQGKPCKLLVTYDSFRHVKEALGKDIEKFYVIVDEFQSIFTDAKFKSNAELEFVNHLQDLDRVCYVSATPMLEKYLNMLEEFKDLPYFEMNWAKEDPGRVIKPNINVKYCGKRNTIQSEIKKVIEKYRAGNFEVYRYKDSQGNLQEIQSKEAVFYVNSVVDITKAIKRNNLTIDECNILVSDNPANEVKIRGAFKGKKRDGIKYIGKVLTEKDLKEGQKQKMFTFCTRTVYLGADFYSTNAKSFIMSNANVDCLTVDISLDLPQILGRQRWECNPWKNSADIYITLKYEGEKSKKEYAKRLAEKEETTNILLGVYQKGDYNEKDRLTTTYEKVAKAYNYKDDYVAVNRHAGSLPIPVFNKLMMVADIRTFEIQEYDYVDRVTVLSRINDNNIVSENKDRVDATVGNFEYNYTTFIEKMKYLCSQKEILTESEFNAVLNLVPMEYKNYITTLGVEKIKSCSYQGSELNKEYIKLTNQQNLKEDLIKALELEFKINNRYTKQEIKEKLCNIYKNIKYNKTPKANDLEEWFEMKDIQITLNKRRVHGYEIIKKKENN